MSYISYNINAGRIHRVRVGFSIYSSDIEHTLSIQGEGKYVIFGKNDLETIRHKSLKAALQWKGYVSIECTDIPTICILYPKKSPTPLNDWICILQLPFDY